MVPDLGQIVAVGRLAVGGEPGSGFDLRPDRCDLQRLGSGIDGGDGAGRNEDSLAAHPYPGVTARCCMPGWSCRRSTCPMTPSTASTVKPASDCGTQPLSGAYLHRFSTTAFLVIGNPHSGSKGSAGCTSSRRRPGQSWAGDRSEARLRRATQCTGRRVHQSRRDTGVRRQRQGGAHPGVDPVAGSHSVRAVCACTCAPASCATVCTPSSARTEAGSTATPVEV